MSIPGSERTRQRSAGHHARFAFACGILIGVLAGIQPAGAQQPTTAASPPPIGMKNWRYEGNPSGMYTFACGPPQCSPSARLIYQLLPPNPQLTFEQYRQGTGRATEVMQQKSPAGTRVQLLGVDDGSKQVGELSLRLFKARRLFTMGNGERRFIVEGHVLGTHHTASISSTAADEKSADANFMQFAAPLWLLANDKLERTPTAGQANPPAAATDAPPVAVGPDWRYTKGPNDIYLFDCQNARCAPPSRVSYRLYAPDTSLTLAQFRQQQETVVKALQERAPPGTQIRMIETTGDEGAGPRRILVSRREITHPDGRREFLSNSVLLGTKYSASLISSAPDEKAVATNRSLFVLALMLFINGEPNAKQ